MDMVMTELTDLEKKLLDTLKDRGDWMTRREIAAAMGAQRLYDYDIELLNNLANRGLIEKSVRIRGRVMEIPIYRARE